MPRNVRRSFSNVLCVVLLYKLSSTIVMAQPLASRGDAEPLLLSHGDALQSCGGRVSRMMAAREGSSYGSRLHSEGGGAP